MLVSVSNVTLILALTLETLIQITIKDVQYKALLVTMPNGTLCAIRLSLLASVFKQMFRPCTRDVVRVSESVASVMDNHSILLYYRTLKIRMK